MFKVDNEQLTHGGNRNSLQLLAKNATATYTEALAKFYLFLIESMTASKHARGAFGAILRGPHSKYRDTPNNALVFRRRELSICALKKACLLRRTAATTWSCLLAFRWHSDSTKMGSEGGTLCCRSSFHAHFVGYEGSRVC